MKFTNILLLLLVNTFILSAHNSAREARENYIDQFAAVAIQEMQRSGVPASIILAQGILESNAGNSELARDSKNHFGIKCKEWAGRKVYYEDDDYENGKLVKSCFRAYDDVLQSYADHSDFLRTGTRYLWLFNLDITDYRGWAEGLQQSGYATNPAYADLLIGIIEEYALNIFDQPQNQGLSTMIPNGQPVFNNNQSANIPASMAIANTSTNQMANQVSAIPESIVLETPTYQLPNNHKPAPKERKKLNFNFATRQVKAAQRPMRHGVNAR